MKEKKKDETLKELEILLEKNKLFEEEVLRSKADLINYRKRKDEETANMLKFANAEFTLSLLPVLDNFERALKENNLNDELKQYLEGMKLIYNSLKETLESYGLKEIEILHQKFDSKHSDCIYTEFDPEYDDEIILEVFKKGYMFLDKVLRPAQVKVNKKEIEKEKENEENE